MFPSLPGEKTFSMHACAAYTLHVARLAALCLAASACRDSSRTTTVSERDIGVGPGSAFDPAEVGGGSTARPKLVVVGIDGATWDVMDPMLERGELPHIQALVDRGLRGTLTSLPPLSSPVVWTTMATGTFPRSHKILGFTYPFSAAAGRPVSSEMRRDPALWNVASAYGRRVGVVGYFVTHPPEVVNGFMVSDRFVQGLAGSTYPEQLQAEIEPVREEVFGEEVRTELIGRFLPWEYKVADADDPTSPYQAVTEIIKGRVDRVTVRDDMIRRVTLQLMGRPVDLLISYYRLVDHSCHATWKYFDDSAFEVKPPEADKQLIGGVIPEAYRYMDDMLGELVARSGEDVNLLIVSDHGFTAGADNEVVAGRVVLSGNHLPNGIFLAAGPAFREGEVSGLTTIDMTPLMLALLELPISDQLPGRLEQAVFSDGYLQQFPVLRVPSWDVQWTAANSLPVSDEAEEDALMTLRALGYIGEGGSTAAPLEEVDFWAIDPGNRLLQLTGELGYHLLRGDLTEARRLLRAVELRDDPSSKMLSPRVRAFLANVSAGTGVPVEELVPETTLVELNL